MVKTTAAVICGEKNVQLRTFDLPNISADELLVKNISNSICLSTYKAALLGSKHKRVPENIDEVPVMTGHEYAGVIVEVGENLKDQFKAGDYFVLQPAMGLPSGYSAGYSYETFGGNATYSIIPKIAIDLGCVLLTTAITLLMLRLLSQCLALSARTMRATTPRNTCTSTIWASKRAER